MFEGKIEVYATSWCPDCMRVKQVLDKHLVQYNWKDISNDEKARSYVEQINRGKRSVPTIVFPDGSLLVEPSNAELEKKLASLK
jgi:glutaredoxin-like protein